MANSSALPFPIPSGAGDVVLLDEEIRDCGVWSTTSVPASAHPDLGTWCPSTKDDVLPVNRTMKKYKICVTIILNFLLVIF